MISQHFIINCLITVITASVVKDKFLTDYNKTRNSIFKYEERISTGGKIHLNDKEAQVNEMFLKYKLAELDIGLKHNNLNAAGMHFFKAKEIIEASKVFKFLQKMPKGGLLHVHDKAAVSSKWVAQNLFHMPGLLRCGTANNSNILTFRERPEEHGCVTVYVKVSDELKSHHRYDGTLEHFINLYTPTPEYHYSSLDVVWRAFEKMFNVMDDVLAYLPAFRRYYWQILKEMHDDNIMYAEIRLSCHKLYDDFGHAFTCEDSFSEIITINENFKRLHPNFLGIKFIYSTGRRKSIDKIKRHFEIFKSLHSRFPNYIIGFDLVGQEDLGKPLYDFVEILKNKPPTAKFFFHAGETNWYGLTDLNLFDGILLNTTRIGHGFSLMKHPGLWHAVKNRDIPIEVSPISNQVLGLVNDLRNHPGALFIAENVPMVICNDDPGFFNSKGLSYDYYYAIMSFSYRTAGLKTLKQLVWNSIKYSAMSEDERKNAFSVLTSEWDKFIDNALRGLVF